MSAALFPAGTLAGRDSELTLLTGLVAQLSREHRGRAVLIEGEPGIGKSALVQAAAAAAAADHGCQVFWGAGDELGQPLPLLPFLDALAVRARSANPRRNMIAGLLRGELLTDRAADVPAVLAEQLQALVADECELRPVVLVIDDLQWADEPSVALWGRLARLAGQMPLLLAGMMRPVPQRDDLLALRRAVGDEERIRLTPLPEEAVSGLVARPGGRQAGRRPAAARRRRGGKPPVRHRAGRRARPELQPDRHGCRHRRGHRQLCARIAGGGHRRPPRIRHPPGARGAARRGPARRRVHGRRAGDRAGPRRH